MGAGWAALAGGAMVAGGNTVQAIGARQANKAQQDMASREAAFQDEIDRQNAAKLQALLSKEAADQRIAETQGIATGERDALTEVADTVTAARGKVTAAGSESAQGEITRSMEGVRGRASKTAALLARIRAQKLQEQEAQKRHGQYAVDRNRLAGKARSRQRLYPLLMNAAAMKGADTRQAGAATSQLGAILMQYGISGMGKTDAAGASSLNGAPANVTAITEAPLGGWAANNPFVA